MEVGNFSPAVIGMFKNDRLWGDFQALENAQKKAPFPYLMGTAGL